MMKGITIRKLRKWYRDWGMFFIIQVFLLSHFYRWFLPLSCILLIAFIATEILHVFDFKHSRFHLMWKEPEKWKRFKRIYRFQLYVEKIVTILLLLFIAFIIGGLILKQ